MEPIHQTLGQMFREKRRAAGLSLRQLEKLSGVTHSMIDRVEKSTCDIRLSDYDKLCRALKIKVRIIA